MESRSVSADFLAETHVGSLLRFAGDTEAVALLRRAFDVLASGSDDVPLDFLELRDVTIEFRLGARGGMRRTSASAFTYQGDRDQWESRALLLDPLVTGAPGFQYLGDDALGDVGVVVTTYADASL